jgi:hypothetical protein
MEIKRAKEVECRTPAEAEAAINDGDIAVIAARVTGGLFARRSKRPRV